ncbi:MAG: ATP-dependent helicase DeaD [Acidobacteriota bacterium]|nr:ATP-dependent helicase DeaD [Acidobacteriota bacterium]
MSEVPTNTTSFASLGLRDELVATLADLGYEAPTPIQVRTIPVLLSGRDLIGQAQTGTGKTAAFALPMLSLIDPASRDTQALVLAPTRELAMQVAEAIHTYSARLGNISVLPVYGGAPIYHQLKRLERGAHIVVGTPGRLIDVLDRNVLNLGAVKMIVLDEADEMLKMGFIEEVEKLLAAAPTPRQTALFSATMPDEVLRIAKRYLTNPERIEIEHREMTAPAIEQRFLNVSEGQKLEVLTQLLELEENEAVLIFRRTKNGAAELAEKLEGRGFAASAMHGDMNQAMRENVIRRLRAGQVEVVVATDVAARGLDVEQITHVINYDVPHDVEVYVHRIGRTGRAGRSGVATLFITPRERRMMREIERYTGSAIKPMKMPSGADVAARRVSLFKEALRKNLQQGDLDLYVELIEQLVDEGPFDMADVAAAAARMANGSRVLGSSAGDEAANRTAAAAAPPYNPPSASAPYRQPAAARPSFTGPPREELDREGEEGDEKKVRLSMAVGRADGIRPADVVGSIANEAGIPGRDIGPIDIREEITYVTVPEDVADLVLEKVGHAKFRGRPVNMRRAGAGDPPPEQRPPLRRFDERPPRRDYDRPRDDRPPRPAYNQDRPSRPPYNADRPARPPYNADRPARPPYNADRPARPPYNADRPARPPYGQDRPARPPYNPDRPPRREFTDDRPPRRDFGNDRPARPPYAGGGGGQDRPPRRDFGNDRPPFPRKPAGGAPFRPKKGPKKR